MEFLQLLMLFIAVMLIWFPELPIKSYTRS